VIVEVAPVCDAVFGTITAALYELEFRGMGVKV
jgi:hypothetical protein